VQPARRGAGGAMWQFRSGRGRGRVRRL